jgi:hypothetical protein
VANGADSKPEDVAAAKMFFAKHCQTCHAGAKPKGGFHLDRLSPDFNDKSSREKWLKVLEQVKTGAMPPKTRPRPPAQEVKALGDWIRKRAEKAESAAAAQGRVVLRRLNRAEYQNTVRDLLGVELDLKDLLPEEASTNGFDNNAETLHVSSFLMEQYLEAAERVLEAAIVNGSRPWMIKKRFDIKEERSVDPKGSVYRHLDDGVVEFLHAFPRRLPLQDFGVRVSDRQTRDLPPDHRRVLRGHRGANHRLLRGAARQTDRH